MTEALELCLKSVADRRSEMMLDDSIGHGDIEVMWSGSEESSYLKLIDCCTT